MVTYENGLQNEANMLVGKNKFEVLLFQQNILKQYHHKTKCYNSMIHILDDH